MSEIYRILKAKLKDQYKFISTTNWSPTGTCYKAACPFKMSYALLISCLIPSWFFSCNCSHKLIIWLVGSLTINAKWYIRWQIISKTGTFTQRVTAIPSWMKMFSAVNVFNSCGPSQGSASMAFMIIFIHRRTSFISVEISPTNMFSLCSLVLRLTLSSCTSSLFAFRGADVRLILWNSRK